MAIKVRKTAAKTNSDLWLYTLTGLNILVFLITAFAVFVRTETSEVKVPIRLISGNEFVQGSWWNSYLMLAIIFGFLIMSFVYSSKLKKLNPIYRNGVMVFGFCLQVLAAAVLFRVSGLSSLI